MCPNFHLEIEVIFLHRLYLAMSPLWMPLLTNSGPNPSVQQGSCQCLHLPQIDCSIYTRDCVMKNPHATPFCLAARTVRGSRVA